MICPGVFPIEIKAAAVKKVRDAVRCGFEFVFPCMLVLLEMIA